MEKQIANPGQAFALGASWGNPSVDNGMTTEITPLINNTGLVLYTGDIIALDATGTQAILPGGAADTRVWGVVGSSREQSTVATGSPVTDNNVGFSTLDGSFVPFVNVPWVTASMGFTNGSQTITYAAAANTDLGKIIMTPYNATTNANPQIFQVTAVNPGVSYTGTVIGGAGTTFSGTTGTFSVQIGETYSAIGPGWIPASLMGWSGSATFPPNAVVPVISRGLGRVNINGVAAVVASDLIAASGANVVGARTAAGATVAGQTGTFIATTLEAYAARDTSLTGLGITGHDSVRAIIGKM